MRQASLGAMHGERAQAVGSFKCLIGTNSSGLGLKYLCPAEPFSALLNLSFERAQRRVW